MLSQLESFRNIDVLLARFPFLNSEFFGNSIFDYGSALVAFVVFLVVFKIFQVVILHRLRSVAENTDTDIDDTAVAVIESVRPPFYFFVAVYVGLRFLALSDIFRQIIDAIFIVWLVYQSIIAVQIVINKFVHKYAGQNKDRGSKSALSAVNILVKIGLWSLGILLILSNMGIDITALVAGLGIGGVAVAFALQNILSDLFSSFAIFFDKPFVEGDFVIVGGDMGVVKKIGIKTTRIQALQGEEIVISNNELTSARIQNFKKMKERRVVFSLGVTYDTPSNKLEKIPEIVRRITEDTDLVRFDRAHFYKFNDSSLDFEVVYYVDTDDYNKYMDVNQEIHLAVKKEFEKEKIEFAFPSRTVYLSKDS